MTTPRANGDNSLPAPSHQPRSLPPTSSSQTPGPTTRPSQKTTWKTSATAPAKTEPPGMPPPPLSSASSSSSASSASADSSPSKSSPSSTNSPTKEPRTWKNQG